MIHDTQSAQISQKQDERNLYAIMKTMCPPGYHHNGFVATHTWAHDVHVHDVYIYIYVYDSQIVHNNPCFNLFILHNIPFDSQGSEINKNNIFLHFDILSFTKTFFLLHMQ